jgi:hypothetical protein
LVELVQVGRGDHDVPQRHGLLGRGQRRCHGLGRTTPHAQQNGLDVVAGRATAHLDDALDRVDGMLVEQFQNANKMFDAAARPVLFFQGFAQLAEHRRQVPAAEDVGVIERCRSVLQRSQIVLRVEDLLMLAISAGMLGDDLVALDHGHAIDRGLDRDDLEGRGSRHAVAIGVETDHLILVGLGWLHDAGIEGAFGKGQGLRSLLGEALADRLGLAGLRSLSIAQATGTEMTIQRG